MKSFIKAKSLATFIVVQRFFYSHDGERFPHVYYFAMGSSLSWIQNVKTLQHITSRSLRLKVRSHVQRIFAGEII